MKISTIVLTVGLLALAACHNDTRPAWQTAEVAPHLDIPTGVDTPGLGDEMVVPGAAQVDAADVGRDARPPTSVSLVSNGDVASTWQVVTAKLDTTGIGTIQARNDQAHQLALAIKGSELPGADAGLWTRIFHNTPDPNRDYLATIGVKSINGETLIDIDGDGRAVLHLATVVKSVSISDAAADKQGIDPDAPKALNSLERQPSRAGRDASGQRVD